MMWRFVFDLPQLLYASIFQNGGMRKDYLRKDQYYMGIALLSADRSKDPNTQVGACIVNKDDRIVGIGYNGMPNNCPDWKMPWRREKEKEPLDTRRENKEEKNRLDAKTFYVCHAELNAIVNKYAADVRGCRMYVTLFPCNECAKIIVQSGINKVIYLEDTKAEKVEYKASKNIFHWAGVKFEEFKRGDKEKLVISFLTKKEKMEHNKE